METVELKNNADVARIVRAAFPDCRKKRAFISKFHAMSVNSYWDGGSRDYYVVVDLATSRKIAMPSASHPFFDIVRGGLADAKCGAVETDHAGNLILKELPENTVLVRCGVFCGKPATPHIYFREENLPPRIG